MKIKLKNTPEQVELVKAMGSRDVAVAREATEAFAAFIGPVVSKVLLQAGTASAIYSDAPYDEDDNPSLPLDLYYNQSQDYVTTWSQTVAGGLPSSTVEGFSEMKISTYRLDSAVSFLKRYARRGRLDVVSKAVERMSNEVLVKQERNAWAVVLKALAEARSNGADHIVDAATAGTLQLVDLSNLMTLVKRINTSYAGGTTTDTYGLTDLFLSPEIMGQVRELAFNPIGTNNAGTKAYETAPNTVREEIFRNAGAGEIFGVTLHQLVELGVGQKYNTLFASLVTANGGVANTAKQILVGVDLTKESFIRPVARQAESGGTFTVLPDDQFVTRNEKTGFYGFLEEGRVCIDGRAVAGILV
jgi:hypothetical protein